MLARLRLPYALLIVIALGLGSAARCGAQLVIYGAPGDPANGNAFPFGNTFAFPGFVARYQQVYLGALFPRPMRIDAVTFFHHNCFVGGPGGVGIQPATYTIRLSTTSRPVNGLDEWSLDSNLGPDATVFFSADLSGPVGPELTLSGAPFAYNPALGNLLLDITKIDLRNPQTDLFLDARNGTFGDESSRAGTFINGSSRSYGLVTQFAGTWAPELAVPEPGIPALLSAFATTAIGCRCRRAARRRAAGSASASSTGSPPRPSTAATSARTAA